MPHEEAKEFKGNADSKIKIDIKARKNFFMMISPIACLFRLYGFVQFKNQIIDKLIIVHHICALAFLLVNITDMITSG